MKQIDISTEKYPNTLVVVDDEDFEWLNQWNWYASVGRNTIYARRSFQKNGRWTSIGMHRQIVGPSPGLFCDHKDGNGLNNTRSNLRTCSRDQNCRNRPKRKQNASSKYKGVTRNPSGTYSATIRWKNRSIHLGAFKDEIGAALAYNQAAELYHGEFAWKNKI